ncbi:CLUMA_CG012210, isoform A [Clunio marinus]|uniref:CLUMA_CG012210, isoform A n=1 Tax=Clunio marinus TaxID=568069 RepID=A0A1J1IEA5_9DIPT|nr:CLUMA_CG012210, isoform A [Clunio marinus]
MSSSGVKGGKDVSVDVSLEIPEDALTTSEKYCNVYKITYEVRVLLETEGCNDSPEVAVPITIGSVGLKDDETHQTDEMKANNESTKEVAE